MCTAWSRVDLIPTSSRATSQAMQLVVATMCLGLVGGPSIRLVARGPPTVRSAPLATRMSAVDELLELINADKDTRTNEDKAQIVHLSDELEASQQGRALLTDPSFVGNYNVAFFDSSVDGGRDRRQFGAGGGSASEGWPRRMRRAALRRAFRQRGSFQHIVSPTELVNFVCFTFFGLLRGSVVARGEGHAVPTRAHRAAAHVTHACTRTGTRTHARTHTRPIARLRRRLRAAAIRRDRRDQRNQRNAPLQPDGPNRLRPAAHRRRRSLLSDHGTGGAAACGAVHDIPR